MHGLEAVGARANRSRLDARDGTPCLWLADRDARAVEAFVLERDRYALAVTAAGAAPVAPDWIDTT